jgi:hypothetical protein
MPLKSVSARYSLFAALVLGVALGPLAASQQPAWKPFTERRPYTGVGNMLNKDAQASDPAGIHYYAEDLAHLLLPDNAGGKYIDSFADRLAKAEREAREGKRKLIPDTQVVEAYNELARKENPRAKMANLGALRLYRTDSYPARTWTAVITANRNGTNCYPGEAIFLLTVLLPADGDLTPSASPSLPYPVNAPATGSFMTSGYIRMTIQGTQNRRQILKEFNALAKSLGI